MNKQEFQQTIKNMKCKKDCVYMSSFSVYQKGFEKAKELALFHSNSLDESEKPVVPQFVADWVDNSREYDYEFCDFFDCNYQSEEVYRWLKCENRRQSELNSLALSMLVVHGRDAVIVEEEKLYTVELPNPNAGGHVVLCKTSDGIVSIAFTGKARWQGCKNFQLTEAEIKQDFDWAWRFAKEVKE